jgi:hypothetical protein
MRAAMEGKGYPVAKYCELLVDKATQRMETTDAFADWEKDKSNSGTGKKVSFSKLQLNIAVQEAVTKTVHETMAAMEKKGWQKS